MIDMIKHGKDTPTINDLENYQLGWSTTEKKLFIKDKVIESGKIYEIYEISPQWEEMQ